MLFKIFCSDGEWVVSPLSGRFEGQIVARADGVNLRSARFYARTIEGTLKAMWGTRIMVEDVYSDRETLRGLQISGVFDTLSGGYENLTQDYDGFLDHWNRPCRRAKKVITMGMNVYVKGAE